MIEKEERTTLQVGSGTTTASIHRRTSKNQLGPTSQHHKPYLKPQSQKERVRKLPVRGENITRVLTADHNIRYSEPVQVNQREASLTRVRMSQLTGRMPPSQTQRMTVSTTRGIRKMNNAAVKARLMETTKLTSFDRKQSKLGYAGKQIRLKAIRDSMQNFFRDYSRVTIGVDMRSVRNNLLSQMTCRGGSTLRF